MAVGADPQPDKGNDDHHGPGKGPKDPKFQIKIDRTVYKVHAESLTGAQLRQLPNPEVGPDRDLFEVVPGGSDLKVNSDMTVVIRHGLRFFTAPAQINPGKA